MHKDNYTTEILKAIPQQPPFRWVDGITGISDQKAEGWFQFPESLAMYKGHFPEFPITPGVILTECVTQCAVLPLALHLYHKKNGAFPKGWPVLAHTDVEFIVPVRPGERVVGMADLVYFRRDTIQCRVNLRNEKDALILEGVISAMLKEIDNGI